MRPEAEMESSGAPSFKMPTNAVQPLAPLGVAGLLRAVLRDRESLLSAIFTRQVPLAPLIALMSGTFLLLAGFYGFVMGLGNTINWAQAASSAVKVPLLYLLSLAVCLPVLYIINILMGSRLGLRQMIGLILVAFNLNAILLASFGPIVAFFIVTGSNYHFLKLLNVGVMGLAGLVGMLALYKALVAMCESSDVYPRQAVRILLVWILIFGFVGTQMAWTLRPFLGSPGLPFELFRGFGEGNFYQAIWQALEGL